MTTPGDGKRMGTCDYDDRFHLRTGHKKVFTCLNWKPLSSEVTEQPRAAEQFAKSWEGFKGEPSQITDGKTLDPLAPWQIAVAVRFAEAYASARLSSALEIAKRKRDERSPGTLGYENMQEIVDALEGK